MDLRALTIDDAMIERLRVSSEVWAACRLDELPAWYCRGRLDRQEYQRVRRGLLGESLLITREVAPAVHALVESSREALGVELPVEAFQIGDKQRPGWNARLDGHGDSVLVTLIGSLLLALDEDAQRCVVGHELGHHLAHGLRPAWFAPRRRYAYREQQKAQSILALSAELTADRFGLLACQDLDAALRVEMAAATALPVGALGWSPRAYLAQSVALIEEIVDQKEQVRGETHPEHSMRAYAAWLFSESDVYRELTGRGSGARSIEAVNARIAHLIGAVSAAEREAPRPVPEAPATTKEWGFPPLEDRKEWAVEKIFSADAGALKDLTTQAGQRLHQLAQGVIQRVTARPDAVEAPIDEEELALLARFKELEARVKK